MKPATHPTALRMAALLSKVGVAEQVVEFEQPTRTSAEAAAALGCDVAQIAKSVVFRGLASGQAVVVVTSGANRVSEAKVAAIVGEALGRADADFVRNSTGFVIGGVAPIGHATTTKVVLDEDLKRHDRIWAAAGTPFSMFPLKGDELQSITGADWADVKA